MCYPSDVDNYLTSIYIICKNVTVYLQMKTLYIKTCEAMNPYANGIFISAAERSKLC